MTDAERIARLERYVRLLMDRVMRPEVCDECGEPAVCSWDPHCSGDRYKCEAHRPGPGTPGWWHQFVSDVSPVVQELWAFVREGTG